MARIRSSEAAGRGSAGILHADLDSFFASVEQRDDPRLRDRPVIVGGGVVLAASYEAKACGVRSAMGGRQAMRLCPEALVVPPRFAAYVEASRRVFAIFDDTTPLVEGLSIDEAFLDVAGLRRLAGPPEQVGADLRRRVREEVGLPISVGIARTKYLAKVASAVSKPDGLLRVAPGREQEFLHPLPIERLWGVGRVTAAKLHAEGIRTIGELARREELELTAAVGQAAGRHLWALANLRDPRPVEVGRRRRSIGSQCAIGRPGRRKSHTELDALLAGLVDRVARRLRGGERIGRTFTLRLRFDDFTRATRSTTIPHSTAATAAWLETGRGLLEVAWPLIEERGCTLLGITISGLVDAHGAEQLELPLFAQEAAAGSLDLALDRVRARYGGSAVTRGSLVGRHTGLEMPTLPDHVPPRRPTRGTPTAT
ncbi:DNA polymerase IV [Nocardioides sp. YIM 152315]|uniref:DNA polymerase IV n=1 Tax=Nocardioides sp. YIM 152315 TaxID=3031760 RepID=UPI0023DA97CB|nr:DNA polymerase IV [Nocardioides sp. YIM 152315]MDF1604323.1 DNA polymerase IV [Nocardioides sp. YIM 152315]